jgi:hypothetical protein
MRKVFFILLIAVPASVFCQIEDHPTNPDGTKNSWLNGGQIIFSGSLSYQKQLMGEIGLMDMNASGGGPCNPPIAVGPKFSSEFNFISRQFFIGPKISYEADFILFGARLNIIDYTDFKQNDFRFTPEIGLTIIGFIDLFYGYNIPLSSTRLDYIGTNRITLTINLFKY